jgi:DNA-binding FadR family transcriptional regulator
MTSYTKTGVGRSLSRGSILSIVEASLVGRPIRVPKTSEVVADYIRADIVRGDVREGDFLPPEAQLMERYGVSRPTLREAVRILEVENLIAVARGSRSGAKVLKPSVELVSRYAGYVLQAQGTTIADLYQARLAIEPAVVRWLATDRGAGTTDKLRNIVARLSVLLDEGRDDEFIQSLQSFHNALVEASGNKTLGFMNAMLLNLAGHHEREYNRRHPELRDNQAKTLRVGLKSFEKLIVLIEAGEVEEAVAHWRLHLNNAVKTWAGAGEGNRVVDSLGR